MKESYCDAPPMVTGCWYDSEIKRPGCGPVNVERDDRNRGSMGNHSTTWKNQF